MPLRVSNSVEKNTYCEPIPPVVVPAATKQDILSDVSSSIGEWVGRYIQNVGANDCYYAFGHDCDPTNFNGMLAKPANALDANGFGVGQQLDVSNFGGRISVYSIGGTTISITSIKRADNQQGTGGILNCKI